MRPTTDRGTDPRVERARQGVALVFALSGLALASWLSRTPAVRDRLDLDTAQLGLLLVCMSIGSVSGLPLSGPIVHRIGTRRAVLGFGLLVAVASVGLAVGLWTEVAWVCGISLVATGIGISTVDVAMNVEGADVERRLGRTLMPRFHAGFSLGTVGGALLGAGCAALGVELMVQLVGTALLVAVGMVLGTSVFLDAEEEQETASAGSALRAWREPRTLVIGLMVLAFAFTEGSANDWLAVALVDGYDASETVGAVAFGAFVAAMTVGRMFGDRALARWGRVPVLRATAVTALAGLGLVVLGPSPAFAVAGAFVWGIGASLGFPVGMSAAADEPARAAGRVSVVASIGYVAFLAGPPLIGFVAHALDIRTALVVVLAALVVGLVTAGQARERPDRSAA